MRILLTESGARYEVEGSRIRRNEGIDGNAKRADGEWVGLLSPLPDDSLVGVRLVLDTVTFGETGVTTRTTTPVVLDEWIPA